MNVVKYVAKTNWRILWLIFVTFALSHTIQAEWRAAQMDERAMEGLEDSDEDGVSFS